MLQVLISRREELVAASLRCTKEFVAMCSRLQTLPVQVEALEAVVLLNMEGGCGPCFNSASNAPPVYTLQ